MRRRFEDPLLAGGPIIVAAVAAASLLAGIAALIALIAIAGRWVVADRRRRTPRSGAPVVIVADLEPRRPSPRTEVSVAALTRTGPGVRALRPAELHGGRVRRATARRRSVADPALRTACLHVATRGNARMTDAAAVRLGLADEPLAPLASDPDPLLLFANWG
jgi:hypothetical protein